MYDTPPTDRDLRRERLGTRIALISATLTVAAVVVTGVIVARNAPGFITVTDGEPDTGQLAVPGDVVAQGLAAPPFSYTFHGYTAGELKVSEPMLVTPGYQEAWIRRPYELVELEDDNGEVIDSRPGYDALLTVYRPGVYDPERYLGQERITVRGRDGFWAENVPYQREFVDEQPRPGVAWQYADDAWAVISMIAAEPYPRADLLAVAEGLTMTAPYPATTPIDLVTVPEGYTLTSGGTVDDWPLSVSEQLGSIRLTADRPEYRGLTMPVDVLESGVPTIAVRLVDARWTSHTGVTTPGAPATCVDDNTCVRLTADGRWLVEGHAPPAAEVDPELLERVVGDAVLADVPNRGSWFPLVEAAAP
ncbi:MULTISPECIES: hypothetical protein [Catenuloplanes]|uniref:Uncharacterized protein n=1 Tax=Catenuloplanes niger TaxID=587534 RepID=A0AAE3ZY56_9ACTN|nr:hypothetical protein [Catenuloplanes niger]MDR7326976.1 hypothetical protein [Catenuloplanes niger]